MISCANIQLIRPRINFRQKVECPEVNELVETIDKYFQQTDNIYDCELICSNNEYRKHRGKFGTYLKREDISFNLRELKQLDIYRDRLVFKTVKTEYCILISPDFFYFIECEEDYYI